MSKSSSEDKTEGQTPQFEMPDDSAGYLLAERSVWHLMEKKGDALTIIDLRGRSDVCDFYVVCTGYSGTQVGALAKHLHKVLASAGHKAKGLEGMNDGRWALLDFFDVVVHVFKNDARDYFDLERLWGDAPRLDLTPDFFAADDVAARHPDLTFVTPADLDAKPQE